jgi:Flp pilus assembly protein TadD
LSLRIAPQKGYRRDGLEHICELIGPDMSAESFSIRDTIKAAQKAEKSGDFAMATRQYALVASRFPNHPIAGKRLKKLHKMQTGSTNLTQNDVNQLVSLLQSGEMQAAVETSTRLICLAPKEAVLHNFQGIALSQISEYDRAERAFKAAIKLRPNYAEALGNLGSLLCDLGKNTEAEIVLGRALKLNPNIVEANNSMGYALSQIGRSQDAIAYLDTALELNPNYINAYNSKGLALSGMGDFEKAIDVFEAGLKINPSSTDILTNLGYTYSQALREKDAIATLQKAIQLLPADDAEVLTRLSVIQSQVGDMQNAKKNIQAAIKSDPDKAEAHRILSTLTSFNQGDPEIAEMKGLFDRSAEGSDTKMHLGFGLGKAFEDMNEPKKAFQYWLAGNKARRQQFTYSVNQDREIFEQVKSIFDQEFFATYSGQQNQSRQPIFVVGMMRSGTTLVEQILSGHDQVYGAGELTFVDDYARNWLQFGPRDPISFAGLADQYLDYKIPSEKLATRVIDKMPINFLWVGFIRAAFPNAKIINLVRDPRDVGLSIFKNYFSELGNRYAYDLAEIAAFYLLYQDMIAHWNRVLPGAIYDVSYEKIVADIQAESGRLLEYCDLIWQQDILDFQKTDRVVKTASVLQVRKPIYSSSVKSWKNYEGELAPFIQVLENAGALD